MDYWIFCDIDGTLLTDKNVLTDEIKKVFINEPCLRKRFVLVSARMPQSIFEIHDELMLETPIVSYNGALIINNDMEVLADHSICSELVNEVYHEISSLGVSFCRYINRDWLVSDRDKRINKEEILSGCSANVVSLNDLLGTPCLAHKLLLITNGEATDLIIKSLQGKYNQLNISKSKEDYIEITNLDANKANSIRFLCDYFHINRRYTASIGDGENDIGMFYATEIGVAMGNAPSSVKNAAKFCTSSNNRNGVAQAIALIKEMLSKNV